MKQEQIHSLSYLPGFANEHSSEAIAGAVPEGQFSPQKHPLGLYTEKFSGTAFTAPRAKNRRTWFYRIRPSVALQPHFVPVDHPGLQTAPLPDPSVPPVPLRWDPFPLPGAGVDFVDGLLTVAANGSSALQQGMAVHLYLATDSMRNRYCYDADGELLLVPQLGALTLRTECGILRVEPQEIAVVPRGMKFAVDLDGPSRGYVCENYGAAFELPERGPVGSDGYANDRDFLAPSAAYEDRDGDFRVLCKSLGQLYEAHVDYSPLDVVGWVGTAVPYKYDLRRFMALNSVSFDHPDPSIFTVLTSPSDTAGTANVDFVIFPPRWLVAENTFRPPWFHRNAMSEFMGLIDGQYDAKKAGFEPGGMSLHNAMVAHGPEAGVFESASSAELLPQKLDNTMAFMFESRFMIQPTTTALSSPHLQMNYVDCWAGLSREFKPR